MNRQSLRSYSYHSCIVAVFFLVGCAFPQHFWPQKDIVGSDAGSIPGQQDVLIASRSSDYKQLLVEELQKQLFSAGIPHKTIGVGQLRGIDASSYSAVVVINTCLAWGLDHEINGFLNRQQQTANIILLTTSGEGTWLPDKQGRDFDAISGASVKTNVGDVAQDLLERIQERL